MKNKIDTQSTQIQDDTYIWKSEVRGYELDIQGIVNNANYFHYFDHARVKYLFSKGIDWTVWHANGFDLVLMHTDMAIKSSLIAHDQFYVTSIIERIGKLKIVFKQKIFREGSNTLIAEATNICICVTVKNNRPSMPDELAHLLFSTA